MSSAQQMCIAGNSSGTPTEAVFITPGIYTWIVPTGVTSISIVVIGGGGGGGIPDPNASYSVAGGGGGGGGLAYRNNLAVTPGQSCEIAVGSGGVAGASATAGGESYFKISTTYYARASGGNGGTNNGSVATGGSGITGTALRSGGDGGATNYSGSGYGPGGGGGAAGYYTGIPGHGGYGRFGGAYDTSGNGLQGQAGGGGGGGGGNSIDFNGMYYDMISGFNGGGSRLFGASNIVGDQGSAGSNGYYVGFDTIWPTDGGNGSNSTSGLATFFGGGGGGGYNYPIPYGGGGGSNGMGGAVRIVWPGSTRQFPSTNVA